MPDARPSHTTVSLLNQPTPPYHGPAASLYGERGPKRSYGNLGRKRVGPPASIADHVDDALKHVAGLTPRQRLAVHNEMVKLCRDISFIRMIAESARGPWSQAAVQDEGRQLY
jgi:hypothetical protein